MIRYVTLEEVKSAVQLPADDELDDAHIERAIRAAAGAVEKHCKRRFWLDETDVARRFTAESPRSLLLEPDLAEITTLETDDDDDGEFETEWSAGDYELLPLNHAADGEPATEITAVADRRYFPAGVGRVRVTGKWGWPTVPAVVAQATLMVAIRLLKRTKDAPLGIAQVNIDGAAMRLLAKMDADGEMLLQGVRWVGAVA